MKPRSRREFGWVNGWFCELELWTGLEYVFRDGYTGEHFPGHTYADRVRITKIAFYDPAFE